MRTIRVGAGALVAVLLVAASPGSAQLVTNGGFETGTFAGWTQGGNTGFTGVDLAAHSGGFGAYFGPIGTAGTLSQSIATTPGALYDLSFWLQNAGGSPNSFAVSWGGSLVYSFSNSGGFAYTPESFSGLVGAAGSSTLLEFSFRQDPDYFHLDDVSVTAEYVVPEPATMTLLAAGLVGMIGAGMRRRKA